MKINIYELLGMIKDGKAPKKIICKNKQYELNNNNEYHCQDKDLGLFEYLFSMYYTDEVLNNEVTILETTIPYKQENKQDKIENNKIKNLPYYDYRDLNMETITQEEFFRREFQHIEKRLDDYHNKINEIISRWNNER